MFSCLLMSALMLVAFLAGCGSGGGGEQGSDASENIVTLRNTGFLTTSDPNQTTNTHEYTAVSYTHLVHSCSLLRSYRSMPGQ